MTGALSAATPNRLRERRYLPWEPLCRSCEKGQSAFNTPARLVASMVYDLPVGRGKALLKS
jgi:hypothetical protein